MEVQESVLILIDECEHKPENMEVCKECKGRVLKDCKPNPLNCIDFCIMNHGRLKELGFDL